MSLADQLTVARAAAVPFVVLLYSWNFDGHAYWATALFCAAMTTDWLDGRVARRHGRTSPLGSLLDPIADKTFVLAALTAFVVHRELSLRDFAVILSRDIGTAVGAVVAWLMPGLTVRSFRARLPGKVVTVLQLVALLVLCVAPRWLHPVVLAIGLASVVALADYTLALALALPRRR